MDNVGSNFYTMELCWKDCDCIRLFGCVEKSLVWDSFQFETINIDYILVEYIIYSL